MAYCYILYSPTLDRFYIGSTELPPLERLELHLQQFYGTNKFTAKADDWVLFLTLECPNIVVARKVERHVKKMKSSKYIKNLKAFTDMQNKLINRFCEPGSPR